MASTLDKLLGRLQDLLKFKKILSGRVINQIQAFQRKGRLLIIFLSYTARWYAKHEGWRSLCKRIEVLADMAKSFVVDFISELKWKNIALDYNLLLPDLLQKIDHMMPKVRKFFRVPKLFSSADAEHVTPGILASFLDFLVLNIEEVLHFETNFTVPAKDQFKTLRGELKFLITFLGDMPFLYPEHQNLKILLKHTKALAKKSANLIYLFLVKKMDKIMAREMNDALSDILQKIEMTKAAIRKNVEFELPMPRRSKTSNTDEFVGGFVDSLLENLEELLAHKSDTIVPLIDHVRTIHEELGLLKSFLVNSREQRVELEDNNLKDLAARIGEIGHGAEYVIESFVVKDGPIWYFSSRLSNVAKELKLLRMETTQIYDEKMYDIGVQKVAEISRMSSQNSISLVEENVVGFDDEALKIIEVLTGKPAHLEVISIVGMAGIGKTTLAKKIYNDPLITYHFYICSWCYISRVYQKRALLLDILSSFTHLTDQIYNMSDASLADELRKCLMGKRYLIVMDDVWSPGVWKDLRRSFPDNKNGSRILLTSRLNDVALEIKPGRTPYELPFLTEDECWNLLQEKAFPKEGCPPELVRVGKQIATNCQGLPLAVVVIGGLLAKMDKTVTLWKQVAGSLSANIARDPEQCMDILEKSYQHLPDHLRPCFIYCGALPEDAEISVQKLVRLWIAEGFIRKTEEKSLEDIAEEYLMDLIGRSLILVAKRRSDGGVKTCRMHDLLRDLCLKKAGEENFLKVIDGSFSMYEHHRCLCVHSQPCKLSESAPFGLHVRTLLCFSKFLFDMCHVSLICQSLKLLKILDLGIINIVNFPCELGLLVNLRYLAIRGEFRSIPSSVGDLINLETLLLNTTRPVQLSDDILKMFKLRHLHVNRKALFNRSFYHSNTIQLDKLQSLSTPIFCSEKEAEKVLRCLPNLRKLKCKFSRSWNSSEPGNSFPSLNFLVKLESLNITWDRWEKCPWMLREFPSSLKKITMSKFRLPWNEMSTLGRLPNLEVLKLKHRAFAGPQWNTSDGEFQKLKFLKFQLLDIEKWKASSDQFPRLEWLVLEKCRKLEEIPSDLGNIFTLQMVEVNRCSISAQKFALKIQQEQEDIGNEELKFVIYPHPTTMERYFDIPFLSSFDLDWHSELELLEDMNGSLEKWDKGIYWSLMHVENLPVPATRFGRSSRRSMLLQSRLSSSQVHSFKQPKNQPIPRNHNLKQPKNRLQLH